MATASHPKPPPIRACLFDMDGLLINSEDIYSQVTNEVLEEYGRPIMPWKIKAQLQGRPGPEATRILLEWAQIPLTADEYIAKISVLQRKYFPSCQILPGVLPLLETLNAPTSHPASLPTSPIHIALATSSHAGNYALKTDHLPHLTAHFPPASIVKGDDPRIRPGRGKPAPDIYLLALETINARIRAAGAGEPEVRPDECLVFEDAVPGVEAGRRAGMQVVWCPLAGLLQEFRGREEEVLAGLTGEHKEKEEEELEKEEVPVPTGRMGRRKHAPGELGDGWGRLVASLENFPYAEYGIKTQS